MSRLQFFIDHIGKKIFRTRNECNANKGHNCAHCEDVYQNGLIVESESHASYLSSIEAETNIRYYATIEERDNSENILPNNQADETAQ